MFHVGVGSHLAATQPRADDTPFWIPCEVLSSPGRSTIRSIKLQPSPERWDIRLPLQSFCVCPVLGVHRHLLLFLLPSCEISMYFWHKFFLSFETRCHSDWPQTHGSSPASASQCCHYLYALPCLAELELLYFFIHLF